MRVIEVYLREGMTTAHGFLWGGSGYLVPFEQKEILPQRTPHTHIREKKKRDDNVQGPWLRPFSFSFLGSWQSGGGGTVAALYSTHTRCIILMMQQALL